MWGKRMSKLKFAAALAGFFFVASQAAQAEPKYVLDPYVCNVGGAAEAADAQWVQIPGRGGHTLQLTLEQPEKTTYVDFPGGYINNFLGNFESISFAVGPVKSATSGIINDVRIGPHVVGLAHFPGQSEFIFDIAALNGTVNNTPDSFGFRTVTVSAAQLAGSGAASPLPPGAFVDVMTVTVAGAVAGHIPLTEDVDSIVINGRAVLPDMTRVLLQCPVNPPAGSGI
jgi:hypothetical protein